MPDPTPIGLDLEAVNAAATRYITARKARAALFQQVIDARRTLADLEVQYNLAHSEVEAAWKQLSETHTQEGLLTP